MGAQMLDQETVDHLSSRLVAALTEPRLEALETLLSDDFVLWHNFSKVALTRHEALTFFHNYFPTIRLRYDDINRFPTARGWVQQHLVSSDGPGGAVRELAVCMVITVADGRITRIDEYLDSAQTGGF